MHDLSHLTFPSLRNLMLAVAVAPILLLGPGADRAWAQASSGPFTRLPKITASDAAPDNRFGASIAISGDVALAGSATAAYVFYRGGAGHDPDAWREITKLILPGVSAVSSVAVTADTALLGGPNGQVSLFERNQGGQDAWGFVTTLVSTSAVPARMAISGDTAVVTQVAAVFGEWVVHVFQRNQGGPDAWGEVTTLTSPSVGSARFGFGIALAIDRDTVLVGQTLGAATVTGAAFIYGRNRGGANAWGLVTALSPTAPVPTF